MIIRFKRRVQALTGQTLLPEHILTPDGWRQDLAVDIGPDGRISALRPASGDEPGGVRVGALLPAPGNAHSHSFQRAMAGLSESKGPDAFDDFWSWRKLMYFFVENLTPDEIEIIAAQTQMEMLEAGYASIGEFHYLHHQVDGTPYDNVIELSERQFAAALETGIGYTHLPVLYMRGGMDGRPLAGGQCRFGCSLDQFADLFDAATASIRSFLPHDSRIGVAPHSLRAVDPQALSGVIGLAASGSIHIHAAEQTGEVDEALAALGARPVEWLLGNANVNQRWCLVHATHMTDAEIAGVASAGAAIAACPITESNLGDGVFEAKKFLDAGGRLAIGSDSNIRISVSEELRTLEHSQRLRDRRRVILADNDRSCGRLMYDAAVAGGAQALARNAGRIEVGALADLVALDIKHPDLAGLSGDRLLDAWIFASGNQVVQHVWAAGRHVVSDGMHIRRNQIASRFNKVIAKLRANI